MDLIISILKVVSIWVIRGSLSVQTGSIAKYVRKPRKLLLKQISASADENGVLKDSAYVPVKLYQKLAVSVRSSNLSWKQSKKRIE
jgi:hypothetical protein